MTDPTPRIYVGFADLPKVAFYRKRWDGTNPRDVNWLPIASYTSMVDPLTNQMSDWVAVGESNWIKMSELFNEWEWCSWPGQPAFKCTIPPIASPQPPIAGT